MSYQDETQQERNQDQQAYQDRTQNQVYLDRNPNQKYQERTLQPYQDRLVIEKNDLNEKLAKLKAFIFGEGPDRERFLTLDDAEKERLLDQYVFMKQYAEVLEKRLAGIGGNNLDGTTPIKATPFDAHEQATRGVHIATSANSPDPDPASIQEFPKAVDHIEGSEKGHKEAIVVNSAEEEKAYQDAKASPDPRDPVVVESAEEEKARLAAKAVEEQAYLDAKAKAASVASAPTNTSTPGTPAPGWVVNPAPSK
jgi:hypothetical protein